MNNDKKKRIEAAGWKVGSVDEFLSLTPEEVAIVDMRFNLAKALIEKRQNLHISQSALAKRVKTTQPRIALVEKGAASVSLDFMVRSLLAAGASKKEIAVAMAR
jgi:DNA-binding XRE family transcriptional regulator